MNFDFELDLVITLAAVFVAGLAAVLGIWMERDRRKPPRYAWALSALIVLATLVSLAQSYLDQREQDQLRDDMARLLTTMDRIASESDNPALQELVTSELNAQSRSDPSVVEKVAQRVSDEGRDPGEVLGKHLDAAELEKVSRKSSSIKPKQTEHVASADAPARPRPQPITPEGAEAPKKEAVAAPLPKEAQAAAAQAAAAQAAAAAAARAAGRPVQPGAVPPGAVPPGTTPTAVVPAPTPTPGTEAVAAPKPPTAAVRRAPIAPKGRKPGARKPAPKK
ncbi:MAG: hypothetical protein IPH07_22875 [Deltaproteobacteria bacterium]|nr:hypothetical protein [Deltaproteobacteria bacterium]MBK8240821.1 hypothetical protein [Deltaproteobacteria bacterium]MBK8714176.1 hypothetical protein [Deltaproteobacteria bacterium]MBP7291643.1 hypothetical protein [Nannocystaceae bacterium]